MSAGADHSHAGAVGDVEADDDGEPEHRPIDEYESAAERARDVHIRDIDTEPRWNGHAPTEATAYGPEMKVSEMVVCTKCGAVDETRAKLADGGGCSE